MGIFTRVSLADEKVFFAITTSSNKQIRDQKLLLCQRERITFSLSISTPFNGTLREEARPKISSNYLSLAHLHAAMAIASDDTESDRERPEMYVHPRTAEPSASSSEASTTNTP
jgi:hypothetical protein